MSTPTFAETHNLVTFLEKPAESAGFEQIVDFLKSKPIHYALTIQVLVDKTKVIITKDSIRSDLRRDDAEGTACLLNEAIFEGLARMGAKTTAWNEFSSTMASAIICLADNQKFNFSKYIFDNMVKSLERGVKFYLFLRFLQVFLDKQVEGMTRHKEMYIISSHTKNIFADMRRIGASFSRDEDHVSTPSSDPLPSGEDSSTLNELMVFCTNLQEHVLDLQKVKGAQAKEMTALKKKVSKLNKWRKSRSRGLKRLKKIGSGRRVKSPMKKDSLSAHEDASKQGMMIEEIDQNAEIALDDETQRRKNDDEMFGVNDLAGEEVVMETIIVVKDSATPTTDVTEDEVTMAQALAALKSTKPKVVVQEQEMSTTILVAATIVTTAVPTPRAKGIVFHEQKQSQIPTVSSSNDKGIGKMIEPEVPIKRKEHMKTMMDADRLLAERLQAREREEFSEVQKARFTKRMAKHLESDISKKQKVDENVEPVIDDSKELKKYMEIVLDDRDEVLIEATPISSRSPTIIDYKIYKEGKKNYFKIIRADVKDRFKKKKPMDDMDNLLFRTLKTMFEHYVEDTIWKYRQGLAKVKNWKLFESCGSDVRLQVDHDVKMAYDLLRFIKKQLMKGYTPQ
uniref:Synaptobrevin, longin-like domain protein n=1 Tax=Tanacetum cinerariifolium TaxID=118510 RepID=A0A6L2JUZ8_TANCI|nr:hypothetical protein [Tanacetum cinerariifolium]